MSFPREYWYHSCSIGLLIFLIVFFGFVSLGSPLVKVVPLEYNFGVVQPGTQINKTFLISNTGDRTLKIDRIWVGCSCTVANLKAREISPGGSTEIQLGFDSRGYRGKVTKSATIYTNDPDRPRVELKLIGEVRQPNSREIMPSELRKRLVYVIDLRSEQEYSSSHIFGAVNMPLPELEKWIDRLPKGVTFVLYGNTERQMEKALTLMEREGFQGVKKLFGGLRAWMREFGEDLVVEK